MTYKIIKTGSRLKERQTRRLVLAEQAALVNNYAGSGDLQSPLARQDVNPFYDDKVESFIAPCIVVVLH